MDVPSATRHSRGQPQHRGLTALGNLPGPRGLPLLGNARQIIPDQMHCQLEAWSKIYGNRYNIALGMRKVLVCSHPDDIAVVLKDRPEGFSRTGRLEMIAKELNVAGVFAANGENWRRQRTLVMHAFNPAHVKSYFPALQNVTTRLLHRWTHQAEKSASFELEPDLMRYTVDVTAGLAFGTDINTIESVGPVIQDNLGDILRMLQKRLFAPFPYWHWIKLDEDRRLDENIRIVGKSVQEFIRLARERMKNNPALFDQPGNFLEAMIAARDENESTLSESKLAGNILTLLLAGEDTTAHSLAWFIYLAHQSPDVLLRIREEVDSIIGDDAVPARHEQLSKLDFIEACINESMRLRPAAPLIGVEANYDTVVADVAIPKGTMILLLTRVGAMEEKHFADPCAFRPDRWMASASESMHRKACMPFGAGPRLCPGRFLDIEEMKMVIAMLVKNFNISALDTLDGKSVQERLTFTMAPVGLQLKLRRR